MKTANIDKDAIRREMGLYTIPEVVAVTNLKASQLHRAITVTKEIGFQAGQDGQLLVTKADLSALLAGKSLSEGPKVHQDSDWFHKDDSVPHYLFAKEIQSDPAAYGRPDAKFGTLGVSVLVAEARSFALGWISQNSQTSLGNSGRPIDRLYGVGPDKFSTMLKGCRSHLSHFAIKFSGDEIRLASFAKINSQFNRDIETAIKKAF